MIFYCINKVNTGRARAVQKKQFCYVHEVNDLIYIYGRGPDQHLVGRQLAYIYQNVGRHKDYKSERW